MKTLKTLAKSFFVLSLTCAATTVAAQSKVLHIYNWTGAIAPNTVERFEQQTGIRVVYDLLDSNEVLEAKLFAGKSGYDIVSPSNSFFARQIKAGVYAKLDKSKLPNWDNQDPVMLKLFADAGDTGNQYGMPYLWGTIGLGFNPDSVKKALGENAPVDSWDLLFKTENIEKLSKCGVSVLDSATETLPIALHYLGHDPIHTNAKSLAEAEALLTKIRPYVTYFHSSRYIEDLANGNLCLAVAYSGDVWQSKVRAEEAGSGIKVAYNIPKEGAGAFADLMAIPADADNKDAAHAWINFLLQPEIMAEISNQTFFPNINLAAHPLEDAAIRDDPSVYPPKEVMAKIYAIPDYPADVLRLMNRSWSKIKTGR